MNGEPFYYQQVVTKKALFGSKFEDTKGNHPTWKDYYEYLISLPLDQGGIEPASVKNNVVDMGDVIELDRGRKVTKDELVMMVKNVNDHQKSVFHRVRTEPELNSAAFVSGAAGTGKSYILRMLERYYRLKGYKVFKLAPTGVAAHNISGQTVHRFFGMANQSTVPNFQKLDEYIKLYPKMVLLLDEYSMLGARTLRHINDALVKTTNRPTIMGGVKTIFFGDIAQLLPVNKDEGAMWISKIYNTVPRFDLVRPVRQKDPYFVNILNKVRLGYFRKDVIRFIDSHTVPKSALPTNCLRLYTTRERVKWANERDFKNFTGNTVEIESIDSHVGSKGTADRVLKETRLLKMLYLKVGMPVMLIQNLNVSLGWVNGTIATVFDIDDDNIGLKKYADNDEEDGEECLYWVQRITRQVPGTSYVRTQFPIVPAFATTIHKAQIATIDCVGIYLGHMVDPWLALCCHVSC